MFDDSNQYWINQHVDLSNEEYETVINNLDNPDNKLKLFRAHIKLAIKIANKYKKYKSTYLYDTISDIAIEKLWFSIEKFDPKKGYKFSTYVSTNIDRAIQREIYKDKRNIKTIPMDYESDDGDILNIIDTVKIHEDIYDFYNPLIEVVMNGSYTNKKDHADVLREKILLEKTFVEIGRERNISKQAADNKYRSALRKLRFYVKEQGLIREV